jgi:ubiquinone/menaquinone biosynthesis C-methylase UbiE
MQRILEPEIMSGKRQAIVYAKANFSESNQWFVDQLFNDYSSYLNDILDIGCGPCDIPVRIVKKKPLVRITAVDASDSMLDVARKTVMASGLNKQITISKGHVPGLNLKKHSFDAIISNSLLHHLPNPEVFWKEIKILTKNKAAVYVMDLFRPETQEDAKKIVIQAASDEPELLRRDFYNSLLAAFTVSEIKEQLDKAGLNLKVKKVSERHLLVKGIIKDD